MKVPPKNGPNRETFHLMKHDRDLLFDLLDSDWVIPFLSVASGTPIKCDSCKLCDVLVNMEGS